MESSNLNYNQVVSNGLKCYDSGDYVNARKWFNICINNPKYRDISLLKLIKIEIKEGKYKVARQMLESAPINNILVTNLYGLLETIEYNHNTSLKYYGKCMNEPSMQYKSLLAIAKIYIQLGDYSIARTMFETLRLTKEYYMRASVGLFACNILEQDYKSAIKLVEDINFEYLKGNAIKYYEKMFIIAKYFLRELNKRDAFNSQDNFYMISRLINKDDTLLLNHLEKHHCQNKKDLSGYFMEELDIKDILDDAKPKMDVKNPNHVEISNQYIITLDKPVGFIDGYVTNDICIVTIIGTKDIITMYPILLSNEFDREGLSTSEELKIKRLQGVKHDN